MRGGRPATAAPGPRQWENWQRREVNRPPPGEDERLRPALRKSARGRAAQDSAWQCSAFRYGATTARLRYFSDFQVDSPYPPHTSESSRMARNHPFSGNEVATQCLPLSRGATAHTVQGRRSRFANALRVLICERLAQRCAGNVVSPLEFRSGWRQGASLRMSSLRWRTASPVTHAHVGG